MKIYPMTNKLVPLLKQIAVTGTQAEPIIEVFQSLCGGEKACIVRQETCRRGTLVKCKALIFLIFPVGCGAIISATSDLRA